MASERIQRQIDRLLYEAEEALENFDWQGLRQRADAVLRLDPSNADAQAFLAAAEPEPSEEALRPATLSESETTPTEPSHPSSFASGRYEVKRFLSEGGKKKVYLAHDTLLDRDVAFALIKTDGLDIAGRTQIQREGQTRQWVPVLK